MVNQSTGGRATQGHSFLPDRAERVNDLSVKEAAELLKVSEKTIYRWIRQGVIPAFKFQGQYRFDNQELESWARYKRIGSGLGGSASLEDEEAVNLFRAVQQGGIHYKIEGTTPPEVYTHAVEFFPLRAGALKSLRETLRTTLIERESLVSTAIGQGIALPHPRHPRDWGFDGPAVGIFFLQQPVDFKAMDGQAVFVLFILLCPTVKSHLKMLSQVSHLVHNAEMQAFLRREPTRTELMERIRHAFPPQ
jgi:PTS system nitrogen regulatory IIA component